MDTTHEKLHAFLCEEQTGCKNLTCRVPSQLCNHVVKSSVITASCRKTLHPWKYHQHQTTCTIYKDQIHADMQKIVTPHTRFLLFYFITVTVTGEEYSTN